MRLGVGTGWNAVEYEALGENFDNRGPRQEEQIALLRELWAHDTIDFRGAWHRVDRAGINPRPARVLPVWFGGQAEAVLRRMARQGDGWIVNLPPKDEARAAVARLHGYLRAEGRDPAAFGIDAQLGQPKERFDLLSKHLEGWRALGATHGSVRTMGGGLLGPAQHIAALQRGRRRLVLCGPEFALEPCSRTALDQL